MPGAPAYRAFCEGRGFFRARAGDTRVSGVPRRLALEQFSHYAKGAASPIEIESRWTARAREHRGIFPTGQSAKKPLAQAERGTFQMK
jgi:hypothetical protein